MTEFKSGEVLYLDNGAKVTLDHIHNGMAFVYPMVVTQTATYHGDDFDEYEYEADHLISVKATTLHRAPPLESLSKEVSGLKEQIKELQHTKQVEKDELSVLRRSHMKVEQEVRRWRAENPRFEQITALMKGESLIAYSVPSWKYRCDMPMRLDTNDCEILQLVNRGGGKFGWAGHWRPDNNRFRENYDVHVVEFFDTEEDGHAFVEELWKAVLIEFDKTPPNAQFGHLGTTGKLTSYDDLQKWVDRFPFLSIPEEVEQDRKDYETQKKAKLLQAAKARVQELEQL